MIRLPPVSTRTYPLFPLPPLLRAGLVLVLDLRPLLRLERLVKALGVAASFHHPAGELVDDDDLVVLDDVVGVALEQRVRAQRLVRVVHEGTVVDVVERSEEHTSELQSLMRISYAVFCLKKKK